MSDEPQDPNNGSNAGVDSGRQRRFPSLRAWDLAAILAFNVASKRGKVGAISLYLFLLGAPLASAYLGFGVYRFVSSCLLGMWALVLAALFAAGAWTRK